LSFRLHLCLFWRDLSLQCLAATSADVALFFARMAVVLHRSDHCLRLGVGAPFCRPVPRAEIHPQPWQSSWLWPHAHGLGMFPCVCHHLPARFRLDSLWVETGWH